MADAVPATPQTVKKSSKVIIERYYPKLTLDFETNKRICDEIAIIASKRLRNKVWNLCYFPPRRRMRHNIYHECDSTRRPEFPEPCRLETMLTSAAHRLPATRLI